MDEERRRGGAFYDDDEVFGRYRQHRRWALNPNDVMEEPAVLEELGAVAGLRVLDLGCGDAGIGRVLLDAGCACYLGLDASANMVQAAAATLSGTAGTVVQGDIEDFSAPAGSYDLVLSRMALHHVDDLREVLVRSRRWLTPGGRIVFTVVHPVITSHDARASSSQPRQDWVVDDYFHEGPRAQQWLGATTVWHHRTIETYVTALRDAGYELTNLRECAPRRERFDDGAEFARRQRIPLALLLAARVPYT